MSETPRRAMVAAAVRNELSRLGKSVEDLSEATGILAVVLHERLRGDVAFDVDELDVIGAALGVGIAKLLGEEM